MTEAFWRTAIGRVRPNQILVRGYELTELIGTRPFGDVTYLLLAGEIRSSAEVDFEKVARVFDAAVADLEKAGATLVDPVVIPQLNELLAQRTSGDRGGSEGRWDAYYSRSARRPFKTMTELLETPGYRPRGSIGAVLGEPPYEHLQARETLMFNVMKAMADHQLDALRRGDRGGLDGFALHRIGRADDAQRARGRDAQARHRLAAVRAADADREHAEAAGVRRVRVGRDHEAAGKGVVLEDDLVDDARAWLPEPESVLARRRAEEVPRIGDAVVGDAAVLVLHEVQQRQQRAAPAGVAPDELLGLVPQLWTQHVDS